MVTRTKSPKECIAAAMLMGPEWSYGLQSHTFFTGTEIGSPRVAQWLCAETLEELTIEQCRERRAEKRDEDNRVIQENIRQREEARTHEAGKDES